MAGVKISRFRVTWLRMTLIWKGWLTMSWSEIVYFDWMVSFEVFHMSITFSGSPYTFLICFGGTMTTGPRSMQGMMNGELALQYCHFAVRSASLSVEADQKTGGD